jgi:hypothetical protein
LSFKAAIDFATLASCALPVLGSMEARGPTARISMPTTRAFLASGLTVAEAAIKLGNIGFILFLPGFSGDFRPVL